MFNEDTGSRFSMQHQVKLRPSALQTVSSYYLLCLQWTAVQCSHELKDQTSLNWETIDWQTADTETVTGCTVQDYCSGRTRKWRRKWSKKSGSNVLQCSWASQCSKDACTMWHKKSSQNQSNNSQDVSPKSDSSLEMCEGCSPHPVSSSCQPPAPTNTAISPGESPVFFFFFLSSIETHSATHMLSTRPLTVSYTGSWTLSVSLLSACGIVVWELWRQT